MPLQPPPMFFTHDHHPLPLVDHFKGRTAFLVAGGPSLSQGQPLEFLKAVKGYNVETDEKKKAEILRQCEETSVLPQVYDLEQFYEPGIWSITMNNACRVVKSDAWACVDSPSHFILSNWLNPKVMKFAPICHTQKKLFNNSTWKETDVRTMDCPNMVYYKRNEHFQHEQFLDEDTINWGCHKKYGGGRSIMFATIRILYLLGFRRVFLVGVDMDMDAKKHYAFAQDRAPSSQRGNNSTYQLMQTRFGLLRPIFEDRGFHVFNCNPNSKFTVFDHIPFDQAVASTIEEDLLGIDVINERTEGLYDREAKKKEEKKKKENKTEVKEAKKNAEKYTDEDRADVKNRLDNLRSDLDDAKAAVKAAKDTNKSEDVINKMKVAEDEARQAFRTCEDEKRIKWGEPPKWGLWEDK